jgi:transaldolase/glucose-6-phosphate isomerase
VSKDIVDRIWARDASLWTGGDEAKWLGWLEESWRLAEDAALVVQFAEDVVDRVDSVVLLGMGGSSLAPEVLRRSFLQETFHVLDTTHPKAIRALEKQIDVKRTLFVSSRVSAASRRHSSASRRSAAATRRCRCSAWCPRR